jgi:hypothetical protein
MKIVYLHGLDSTNSGTKNDWLKSISELYDPQINYNEKNIYQFLKSQISEFEPSLLIGSSMGGYFAYEIAKELNIKAVLFNPALHSRSCQPDMTGLKTGEHKPYIYFVFGQNDTIINSKISINKIKKEGYNIENYTVLNYGHHTSLGVFKNEIMAFIENEKLCNQAENLNP